MHLHFDNVNDSFYSIVGGIQEGRIPTEKRETRNGPTLRIVEPTTITYHSPMKRVLFSKSRDCNHFFQIFEAVYMLAGSNLLAPLTYFLPRYADFSNDGQTVSGAYGYRWIHQFGRNQLDEIIRQLKEDPTSRRCVLQMWGTEEDLFVNPNKDKCCNTHIMFSTSDSKLNMTVCNRSNDIILGMLGANFVHFSYLLEYMANCLNLEVGTYSQFSNDMHVYLNNWKPEEWLKDREHSECYPELTKLPLVKDKKVFDEECELLVDNVCRDHTSTSALSEPYLNQVVVPMVRAFNCHKARNYSQALKWMEGVVAPDWRRAGTEWLQRREANWKAKQEKVELL